MLKNSTFLTCVVLLIMGMISCEQSEKKSDDFVYEPSEQTGDAFSSFVSRESLAPPIDDVDVPFQTFSLSTTEEHVFELDNGTRIEVPADIFVDADGNPIQGNIDLHYREFHDAADILTSGIPMTSLNEDGSLATFLQTAGMIEIQGTDAQNQPVFIKEGAAIDIEMASHVDGKGYEFLALDGQSGVWEDIGDTKAVPNKILAQANAAIQKAKRSAPVKPVQLNKAKPVLDFDINLDAYPNLKSMNGLVWQYTGNNPAKNPIKQTWVLAHQWETADISESNQAGIFNLTLKGGDKTFETTVCPSLKEGDFKKALASYNKNLAEYKENMLTLEAKKELVNQQAAFKRAFRINEMGIYNCDRILKDEDYLMVRADFELDINMPDFKRHMKLYHITLDGRAVIPYQGTRIKNLSMNTEEDNRLVAILPNGKIGTFSQEDFDNEVDNIKQGNYTFKLKVQDKKINSVEDLRMLLDDLS